MVSLLRAWGMGRYGGCVRFSLWQAAILALACLFAACSGSEQANPAPFASPDWGPYPVPVRPPVPATNPEPNAPPVGQIDVDSAAQAGYPATLTFAATDPDSSGIAGSIDFGDGSPTFAVFFRGESIPATHVYAAPGNYRVVMRVRDSLRAESSTVTTQTVLARKVLVVQGYGSESGCPDGAGMAARLDTWLPAILDSPATAVTTSSDILYASYSGRWCDGGDGANGAFADYTSGETCQGIDDPGGLAERLRAQVEAVAPAKVVIMAHSMGGLGAAYLVGSDPDWAREHIASVVTFDSPLRGVPQVNLTALRIGGDCSFNSKSTQDLSDGNSNLLRVAETAAGIVPFYDLDATDREGVLFLNIRQAVPSDRTHLDGEVIHWQFGASHNGLWNNAPTSEVTGPAIQQAITCAIEVVPASRCQRPQAGAGAG